jgi:hypothetical protein
MDIYNQQKPVLPYVYRCVEKNTGRFYIGYRFKNVLPANEDFGKHYFTSNEYVKSNFDKFDYEIVAEFADRKSAFAYETKLIRETKCKNQINANKHNKSRKPYQKSEINLYCLLPGCGKYINSSIKRFCCKSHSATYSAKKQHGTLNVELKSPKQTKPIDQSIDQLKSVKINSKIKKESYEYSYFKRHFIGPILPKKIAKNRGIGIYFKEPMPL